MAGNHIDVLRQTRPEWMPWLAVVDERERPLGWVATGDTLTEWASTDSDEVTRLAQYVDKHADALDSIAEYDDDSNQREQVRQVDRRDQ